MSSKFKQVTMAACVALAFAAPVGAYAASGINFDPNGAEAGGPGTVPMLSFSWGPGQVLYTGCFGMVALSAAGNCVITAQAHTAKLLDPNANEISGVPADVIYSFVMKKSAKVADNSGTGTYDGIFNAGDTDNLTFTNKVDANPVTNYFRIYRDHVNDVSNLNGTGFDTGAQSTLILEGLVTVNSFTLANSGQTEQNLDQFPTTANNNYAGLGALTTNGSPSFGIQVTYIDTNYFKDPLSSFELNLDPDISHTDNSTVPFKNIDPSKNVGGTGTGNPFADNAAILGPDLINDIYCGGAGQGPCSGEFQGAAVSTFQVDFVPEPGVLALMGVGLAGLGFATRRRRSKAGVA